MIIEQKTRSMAIRREDWGVRDGSQVCDMLGFGGAMMAGEERKGREARTAEGGQQSEGSLGPREQSSDMGRQISILVKGKVRRREGSILILILVSCSYQHMRGAYLDVVVYQSQHLPG